MHTTGKGPRWGATLFVFVAMLSATKNRCKVEYNQGTSNVQGRALVQRPGVCYRVRRGQVLFCFSAEGGAA